MSPRCLRGILIKKKRKEKENPLEHNRMKTLRQITAWSLLMPSGSAAAQVLITLICWFNEVWTRPD